MSTAIYRDVTVIKADSAGEMAREEAEMYERGGDIVLIFIGEFQGQYVRGYTIGAP